MRLLIICDRPNPPGYIPRVRYLCNYFVQKGYSVTLLTEGAEIADFISPDVELLTFDYLSDRTGLWAKAEWLIKTVINLVTDRKGRVSFTKACKLLGDRKFDAVLCSSTFHSFPLTTAAMIARKKQLPLYVDLRDIVEQTPPDSDNIFRHRLPSSLGKLVARYFKKIHIGRRNKALRLAKAVFSVSKWHTDYLKRYNPNVYTAYNGFDETAFEPLHLMSDKFVLSYFGELTDMCLRYPLIFFEAVRNILSSNRIGVNCLEIRWFVDTNSKKTIEKVAAEFGIERVMSYKKFVFAADLVEKMNESSILLIFSNKPYVLDYHGIMTTKFFEYLGTGRPILITPDNDDELSMTAKSISCGLVSSDTADIESFIIEKYNEWRATKYVASTLTAEDRDRFSRRQRADLMEKIISASAI